MSKRTWREMPEFKAVDLEDTGILGWRAETAALIFEVEASLWPGHALYHPPPPEHWTCYRKAYLVFPGAQEITGLLSVSDASSTVDPDGSIDYGTIDSLIETKSGHFRVIGDFGDVSLLSEQPYLQFREGAA